MADVTVLDVVLHEKPIGTLTLLAGDQTLFAFNRAYMENTNRPILSLSFKDSLGKLITDVRPTRTRLPPFFSNLLPEGPMREYLAERAGVNVKREYFLLLALGRDLPGAVTIRPTGVDDWPSERPNRDRSYGAANKNVLRFSLAGVQLKFSALVEATGGLTIPAQGVGGSWIVKLPSMRFDAVPENEFAMMTLARALGMHVPELKLVALEDIEGLPEDLGALKGNALAVRRFDRVEAGHKVHIEDFAQVFSVYPEDKYRRASYRNIAEVLWAETGEQGITEFIRRLVFNVLIGNADMHLKNWALVYPDDRNAAIAPAYDFVSTIPYLADNKMALTLGKSKNMSDLSLDQLAYLAAKARLPRKLVLDTAKETAERFQAVWRDEQNHLPLPRFVIDAINIHLPTIAIVREIGAS